MSAPRYNVLIDLNGTCHIGDKPTDGAVEAIQKLRAAQQEHQGRLNIRFCSNTSKESSSSLLSRLRRVGLGADLVSAHDVFTSLDAAKRLVSRRKLRALLLLSQSAQSSFTEEPNLTEDFFLARPEMDPATLSPDEKSRLRSCNAVVIGLCPELMTQKWLDEAFRLLSGEYGATEQVALIATHCAMYHRPSEGAPLSMGPGAFVSALEAACRRDADSTTVCGKPSQAFLQECIAGMIAADESMNDYTNIIVSLRYRLDEKFECTFKNSRGIPLSILLIPLECEKIGDDLDADLGKGTWQLGLRRILGDSHWQVQSWRRLHAQFSGQHSSLMTPGLSPATPSPSALTKRDRSSMADEQTALPQSDRSQKRTRYHKLANEQFLDALWQVLEGENQDMQMFSLENESLSPHSHASHLSTGLGAPTGAFPDSLAADWSLGGALSLNVPFTFDAAAGPTPERFPSMQIPTKPTLSVTSSSSAETSPATAPSNLQDSRSSRSRSFTNAATTKKDEQNDTLSTQNQPAQTYLEAGPPSEDLWAFMGTKIPQQHRRSLLHTFLSTTYVLWPTFILSEFLATLKDESERQNATFVCLVIACCAVAARQEAGSVKGGHAAEWGRTFGFFELYLDIRRLAPRNTDWASLNHIQALFYLSHYCFGASGPFGVTRAHYLMNGCVSKCFDVGLHRSAETYTDAFTPSEIEARRRTVWAVYCGDKISAAYGRPVMLRLSDMDVPEINADSDEYTERLPAATSFDRACTLRPWHRAAIRLFCVLERVIDKINLPACSASAALERVMRKKPKRPRQSENHNDSCMADHEPIGFEEELELVDDFRFADTPTPTSAHDDDPMYQAHVERLRTTAAFIKIFIYRHLLFAANTNLSRQPPRTDYRDEMVKWCRELLLSQRKMIQRGDYTDFGSVMSYQLSQTGRGLIPAIYITSRLMDPSQDPSSSAVLKEAQELLVLAYDLLRQLSDRFTASNRQLQIMQSAFRRLDLSLKKRHHKNGAKGAHDSSSRWHGATEGKGAQGVAAASSADKEMTSGLDLIAGVAGAELLGAEGLGESTASNEEEDEFEDDLDRDKKPGWISDLPINQPAEKTASHPVSAFVGWPPSSGLPPREE
ncbi:hypothetical protein [Sporisorium scitamineum]|uniref:Xylanolytic transcriptional activator regulatory domain-containing protein n=1 Tax=Sporisorium scitamineum TaxID=49012 RepID=A0A0F7S6D2_9BASI|nr:hypothetical protein [Sporisorium scitamineum]